MKLYKFLLDYWPTIIVVGVIIYATWVPKPIDPEDIPPLPHIDKLIHAVMMGGFLGAMIFDYKRADRARRLTRRLVWTFAAAAAAFSIVDEVVQGLLPIGRPSDWVDLLADWVGILVAVAAAPPAVNSIFKTKKQA